jgi:hypothetical protein
VAEIEMKDRTALGEMVRSAEGRRGSGGGCARRDRIEGTLAHEDPVEFLAFDELHDEVACAVLGGVEVLPVDNVRVREARHAPRLGAEGADEAGVGGTAPSGGP